MKLCFSFGNSQHPPIIRNRSVRWLNLGQHQYLDPDKTLCLAAASARHVNFSIAELLPMIGTGRQPVPKPPPNRVKCREYRGIDAVTHIDAAVRWQSSVCFNCLSVRMKKANYQLLASKHGRHSIDLSWPEPDTSFVSRRTWDVQRECSVIIPNGKTPCSFYMAGQHPRGICTSWCSNPGSTVLGAATPRVYMLHP